MFDSKYPGLFISFEGIDGAGKSTQIQKLVAYLEAQGHSVVATREPGGTRLGEGIRALLLDKTYANMDVHTELLLVLAARKQHLEEMIVPALQEGKIVVSDRFSDATRAYQGYGGRLPLADIEQLLRCSGCGIEPNLTFVLDIDVAESEQRRSSEPDRFESKGNSFLDQVRQGYLQLAKAHPQRLKLINANQDPEAVFAKVKELFHEVVCRVD